MTDHQSSVTFAVSVLAVGAGNQCQLDFVGNVAVNAGKKFVRRNNSYFIDGENKLRSVCFREPDNITCFNFLSL